MQAPSLSPPSRIDKLRCACGNLLGAYEDGVLVVRLGRRGGQKRAIVEPQCIRCENCSEVWQQPDAPPAPV